MALAAVLPLIALVPAGGVGWAAACMVMLGAPSAVNSALFDSIMGDVAAFDAAKSLRTRTGLFYSLHLIMGRLGRAVSIAICYAILDRIGFHTHAHNTASAIVGFKLLYVVPPMLLQLGIAALMWRFPLDRSAHDAVSVPH
jgi:Na+/melibiose symporter-like transporter